MTLCVSVCVCSFLYMCMACVYISVYKSVCMCVADLSLFKVPFKLVHPQV